MIRRYGRVARAGWNGCGRRGRTPLTPVLRDTAGATAIAYGLLSFVIAVGCCAALSDTGRQSGAAMASIDTALKERNAAPPAEPQSLPAPSAPGLPDLPPPPPAVGAGSGGAPGQLPGVTPKRSIDPGSGAGAVGGPGTP